METIVKELFLCLVSEIILIAIIGLVFVTAYGAVFFCKQIKEVYNEKVEQL